jgi:uncharacterized membrane protein (TIGR02234 family)
MTAAVLGAGLAGALALVAAGQTWAEVTVDRRPPLPPVSGALSGADAAPLVPAAGLVLLAAAVALFAVRGVARVVVGLLLAAAGGVVGWSGVRALAGGLPDAARTLDLGGAAAEGVRTEVVVAGPWLTVLAGVLAVLAGALVVVRGRGWPAMGRRYERGPGTAPQSPSQAAPQSDEDRAQAAWKALDRGEDPTA